MSNDTNAILAAINRQDPRFRQALQRLAEKETATAIAIDALTEAPLDDGKQCPHYVALAGLRLLQQHQALDGEHHQFPSWVRPLVRDVRDPLSEPRIQRTGRLDIIDLANVHSCSFVATQDLAEWTDEGLKILGRTDHSEVRGCSLLATP